jgi:hypothetical protein
MDSRMMGAFSSQRVSPVVEFFRPMTAQIDEVLSGCATCVLLRVAACLAALGLVHKALLFVELLLACSEYEFVTAFLAL